MNDFEEDEQVPYTHEDKVGMWKYQPNVQFLVKFDYGSAV